MKKKEVALAIFLLTGLTLQAQERVTQYKVRDAIEVRTPIMNDSINPKGEKHSTKMLLKTPVVLDLPDAPLQSLTVDTAGYLTLDKADKNSKIYLLTDQGGTFPERKIESYFSRPLGSLYRRSFQADKGRRRR